MAWIAGILGRMPPMLPGLPRYKKLGRLLCAGSGPHMAFLYAPSRPDGETVNCWTTNYRLPVVSMGYHSRWA